MGACSVDEQNLVDGARLISRRFVRYVLLIALFGLAGCADYLPIAGGELQGTVTDIPTDWNTVSIPEIIRFETSAAEPYSVNLWTVDLESYLYVFAGDNRSTWVEHIAVNPNVRLAMNEIIYELSASRVSNPEEFARFAKSWDVKYGNRPQNENVSETYLFRLEPRNP